MCVFIILVIGVAQAQTVAVGGSSLAEAKLSNQFTNLKALVAALSSKISDTNADLNATNVKLNETDAELEKIKACNESKKFFNVSSGVCEDGKAELVCATARSYKGGKIMLIGDSTALLGNTSSKNSWGLKCNVAQGWNFTGCSLNSSGDYDESVGSNSGCKSDDEEWGGNMFVTCCKIVN